MKLNLPTNSFVCYFDSRISKYVFGHIYKNHLIKNSYGELIDINRIDEVYMAERLKYTISVDFWNNISNKEINET